MDPSYKYRAWYKAFTLIEIGNLVTPKTDPGDYIIEKTGDITVYAGESVVLKPGFHAQNGSTFHAYINRTCSKPPANEPVYISLNNSQINTNDDFAKNEPTQKNGGFIFSKSILFDNNGLVLESEKKYQELTN